MKKTCKKALLSVIAAAALLSGSAATVLMTTSEATAETTATTRFEMVDGAAIRLKAPYGLRFIAELGETEYNEIKNDDSKTLGMIIVPYTYLDKYAANGNYADISTKIDLTFEEKNIYEHTYENGDTYYRANGVITDLKLQNYDTEFVGIAYIKDTDTNTYTYADFNYESNARTAAYVAIEAYPDYQTSTSAKAVLNDYIDGAHLDTLGVTQNSDGTYAYGSNTYNTLEDVKATMDNCEYTLTLNENSIVYVNGERTLNVTLQDTTNNVTFTGSHVAWKSSNESVLKIDDAGKMTSVSAGVATVTGQFGDLTVSCQVISKAISFDDGVLPSYVKAGGRATVSVSNGALNVKAEDTANDENNNNNARAMLDLAVMGEIFYNPETDYMAFDLKLPSDFDTSQGNMATIYYQNYGVSGKEGTQSWTSYCDYSYSSFETAPIGYYNTYYFPRAAYEAMVTYNVGSNGGRFVNIAQGILETSEGYYIDNIRAVTAEEKEAEHNWYSFEYGGIRKTEGTAALLYDHEEISQWQLQISNVDATSATYTSELVTDGATALQFTKKSGTTKLVLNTTTESVKEKEFRAAGYIAYDLYVPQGSNASAVLDNGSGVYETLEQGWNTIYAKVDDTDNNICCFWDSTASTYVIDNIRFITEEEYNDNMLSFEGNAGVLRDSTTTNYIYVYTPRDAVESRWTLAVTNSSSTLSNVHYDTEMVTDGNQSLAFHKADGYISLSMNTSGEMYALLKNGFTFWVYADLDVQTAINVSTTNFINGGNNNFSTLSENIVSNTWRQITVTAADINSSGRFLIIQGSTAGTYYFDKFEPIYTVTYDAGIGSVDSETQTFAYGEEYTLQTPTYNAKFYEFLGWYNGDELVPTTGTWALKESVTLTAKYDASSLAENFYNADYSDLDGNGVVQGLVLSASTHDGASQDALPADSSVTADMSYYKFGGSYGLNDFLVFDFTGDNMPIMSFFNSEVTNTIFNQSQEQTVNGYILANGMTTPMRGLTYGGLLGAHAQRLTVLGPYKISKAFDNDSGTGDLTQYRKAIGSFTASMAALNGSTTPYRAFVGWIENGDEMNLRLCVMDLTTGQLIANYTQDLDIAKATWEGDIALHGHFGRETVVDAVYPIEENTDIDTLLEKYKPETILYNGEWDGNGVTLQASTHEGSVNRPNAGSTDMSYLAFNGDYGFGDYVVFDITGSNMPILSFFNNAITNTIYNNASTTADAAGVADSNAHGIGIANGLYNGDGTIYGSGGANACRLIVVGYQKVLCWDDNSNSTAGGFRNAVGATADAHPLSITTLSTVTDTYRIIMGFSANGKLDVGAINMVTGAIVCNQTLSVGNATTTEGSIILYGQFGKTTVLDQVFGVEEDTTLSALIAKYGKDTDYSDEAAVTLDRYAYASLSDGKYKLDGEEQTTNNADHRTDGSTYTTYKNAGFNILLAQDMISVDSYSKATFETSAEKDYMDMAYEAGLKVILTDWHLQILSTPITVSSSGAVAAHTTYTPWILKTDASATTGEAANYLSYLSSLGITADSTRFENRDALDKYVYDQLATYIDHPAFYGVMLGDEPSYHNAYCYGEIYQSIKRVAPDCYVQYNLLPLDDSFDNIQYRYPGLNNYTSDTITNTLIETAYKSYVTSFLDTMGTDYIQYDDYPFKSTEQWSWSEFSGAEKPYIDKTSLRCIQLIAELAKERGLSVKVVTQSSVMKTGGSGGTTHIRQITENDARWLNNYLMGFGVKQINYFTYFTKRSSSSTGEYFVDGGSFVKHDGTTTELYTFMKEIMAENTAFAPTISHFDYSASQVFGSDNNSSLNNGHISWSTSLTAAASFKWLTSVTTDNEYTLVTELYDKSNYNYMYMVMNTIDPNYGGSQSVTITLDSSITGFYVYKPDGTRTEVSGNSYTVTLTAGEAIYVMPKF